MEEVGTGIGQKRRKYVEYVIPFGMDKAIWEAIKRASIDLYVPKQSVLRMAVSKWLKEKGYMET